MAQAVLQDGVMLLRLLGWSVEVMLSQLLVDKDDVDPMIWSVWIVF